ncbi:MAG: hypothetical protein EBV86_03205 [Marivivens sp.]|nr:hypothetical protein [Marivivens sp.]
MIAISNGDKFAFDFLWRFWCFMHCYDDLIDRDNEVTSEDAVKEFAKFFTTISFNPFYEKHKHALHPLIIQLCNRCLDGDEWESSDDSDKRAVAKVIRCGDIEIFFHVAFLTGGWEHMRKLKGLRTYDINSVEQRELGVKGEK